MPSRHRDNPHHDERVGDDRKPASRRRRRFRFGRFLLTVALLALFVWSLPLLVAHTSLRNRLLGWVYPELSGRVAIGRAELSWTKPWELHDVAIQDKTGRVLLRADLFRVERALAELVQSRQSLGTFTLQRPVLHLAGRYGSSNLEDLIAALFPPQTGPSSELPDFSVQITDGLTRITDDTTGITFDIVEVRGSIEVNQSVLTIDASAHPVVNGESGTLVVSGSLPLAHEPAAKEHAFSIQATQLRLEVLEPLLTRYGMLGHLRGHCQLNLKLQQADQSGHPTWSIVSALQGDKLQIRVPSFFGEDALELPAINVNVRSNATHEQITLEQSSIECDVVNGSLSGTLPRAAITSWNWNRLWTDPSYRLSLDADGAVDLAMLAQRLPTLVQLRDGTTIEEGRAQVLIGSHLINGRRELKVELTTDQLRARRDDSEVRWEEPIALQAVIATEDGQSSLDYLHGTSDFIEIQGAGHLNAGNAVIKADLRQVADKLTQVFDLGVDTIAGQLECQVEWDNSEHDFRNAGGTLVVDNLAVTMADGRVWHEPRLKVVGSGQALCTDGRIARLDELNLDAHSDGDRLELRLSTPTMFPKSLTTTLQNPDARLPFNIALTGNAASWKTRLSPWVDLGNARLEAVIDATAETELAWHSVWISGCQIHLKQIDLDGWGMRVREPVARIEGQLLWQRASRKTRLPDVTLTSTSVAARGANIVVAPNDTDQYSVVGDVALRGDLLQVSQWFSALRSPMNRVRGEFELRATVGSQDSAIVVDGTMTARPFTFEKLQPTPAAPTNWAAIWNDQQVQLVTNASYDWATDEAKFDKLYVIAEGLRAAATGTIARVNSAPTASIQGQLEYDLQTIMAKMYSFVGPGILLRGKQTQPFRFEGPLTAQSFQIGNTAMASRAPRMQPNQPGDLARVSPQLKGEATFGWEIAKIYGVTLDTTEMKAELHDGVIDVSPLKIPLGNRGHLQIAPRLELNSSTPRVVLPASQLADNIEITPEICHSWLRYVAPLVANATAAEGRFSVATHGASIPLTNPKSADCSGSVTIHQARLRPGPMADQIVGIVDQIGTLTGNGSQLNFLRSDNTLLEIANQKVDFRMIDGRVYHNQLEVRADDMVIRTSGWVGMDQSVAIVAEIPIQDRWLASARWLAGMQGQSLRIPVHGSLGRPELDMNALRQSTQQMIGGATENLLRNELRRGLQGGLDRLLENR